MDIDLLTDQERLWLTQAQMTTLFDRHVQTVNEHILNVFAERELDAGPNYPEFPDSWDQ